MVLKHFHNNCAPFSPPTNCRWPLSVCSGVTTRRISPYPLLHQLWDSPDHFLITKCLFIKQYLFVHTCSYIWSWTRGFFMNLVSFNTVLRTFNMNLATLNMELISYGPGGHYIRECVYNKTLSLSSLS